MRRIGWIALLASCSGASVMFDESPSTEDISTGWTATPYEDPPTPDTAPSTETSAFDGATLRIVTPVSGGFLALEETSLFEAELLAADGTPLDGATITWTSSVDPGWSGLGASFEDDTLDIGVHELTATAELPNGDRLVYAAGGVLRQSVFSGTYSGLFTVNGSYNLIAFTCSGVGLSVCEPYGTEITGDADCVASIFGLFDLPLAFVFDLENVDGVVTGTAGADILGLLTYDFPASGTLLPVSEGLSINFAGEVALLGIVIDGAYDAERVSLDAGL